MTESSTGRAEESAQHAQDLAEEAARKLDHTRPDAESASAADVEESTEASVERNPSGEGAGQSDASSSNAPMP